MFLGEYPMNLFKVIVMFFFPTEDPLFGKYIGNIFWGGDPLSTSKKHNKQWNIP